MCCIGLIKRLFQLKNKTRHSDLSLLTFRYVGSDRDKILRDSLFLQCYRKLCVDVLCHLTLLSIPTGNHETVNQSSDFRKRYYPQYLTSKRFSTNSRSCPCYFSSTQSISIEPFPTCDPSFADKRQEVILKTTAKNLNDKIQHILRRFL